MWNVLIDFLFPRYCVGCNKYGKDLCGKCFRELSIADQICPECGEESIMGWVHHRCKKQRGMDGLIVIYDYQDTCVRAVIDGIKFGFNKELIGSLLKDFVFETGVVFDYIVPIPLHFYRQNWRGFNQAEEIAKVVGSRMSVSVINALERIRKTKQQSMTAQRCEREKNVRGAFEINEKFKTMPAGRQDSITQNHACRQAGLKMLLVDDVFTSGANMRECTKVLKRAGVEMVWGLALAH